MKDALGGYASLLAVKRFQQVEQLPFYLSLLSSVSVYHSLVETHLCVGDSFLIYPYQVLWHETGY